MQNKAKLANQARGWLIATGCGLLAGYLVDVAAKTYWQPILAGLVLGIVSTLAAAKWKVLAAFWSGIVAVAAVLAKIALVQYHSGHWPITDEDTIAHYGTETQAIIRFAIGYGILVIVPCLVAATLTALARHFCIRTSSRRSCEATDKEISG